MIVGDTMGQLIYLYGLTLVAFLGGSLVSVGGHNPIEAAICGQPLADGSRDVQLPGRGCGVQRCGMSAAREGPPMISTAAVSSDFADERRAAARARRRSGSLPRTPAPPSACSSYCVPRSGACGRAVSPRVFRRVTTSLGSESC